MTVRYDLDILRKRWRRARDPLHLVDAADERFGIGGLAARFIEDPRVRLLILPGDPEASIVELDDTFWEWWLKDRRDPASGKRTQRGSVRKPTVDAALRCRDLMDGKCRSYVALYRHGGLEVELGEDGASNGYVRLIPIVGRIWAALELYREVVERFHIDGPWEVSLALRQTEGGYLANFGQGWAEPGRSFPREAEPCVERNLLIRQEVVEWPEPDGVQALAFRFGARLEDAWGSHLRRFIARDGEFAGQFDRSKYGWY